MTFTDQGTAKEAQAQCKGIITLNLLDGYSCLQWHYWSKEKKHFVVLIRHNNL